ncbi:phosphate ABC transporter permease subunit PstC [Arsenicicoccus piscis]|uniref:Phosphate transport system permease protein n=1 Tax=Arsenicicoccus piscis TaxID=673954 RepID=A0ABQ6HQR6_9MICO|nr:phosphate transport system permease protein [Arsenicicoccus piscis]
MGVFLLAQAIPAIAKDQVNFLWSREWNVDSEPLRFGVRDLLWATVVTSIIAMLLAVPVGVAVALFITEYAPRWLARPAAQLVDLLAAVPSIVYGLWGVATFTPFVGPLQNWLGSTLGWIPLFAPKYQSSLFVVGIVLAIMILPIVTALSREVFSQTPRTHKEAALALGATKWEMIRTAVLPYGQPGVISAAMLALGRALGETIAVTMILSALAPGSPWSWSLFNGGATFASLIANNAAEFDSPEKTGAYIAAGLVLFVLTFVVNAIARIVIERRKAFTE